MTNPSNPHSLRPEAAGRGHDRRRAQVVRLTSIVALSSGVHLAGCAALGGLSRQVDWTDASKLCDTNQTACKDKCSRGGSSTCDYLLVQNIENHPEQFTVEEGLKPSDVTSIRGKLQPYCDAGIKRACAASDRVASQYRDGSKDAAGPSTGSSGGPDATADARQQAAEAKSKVDKAFALLPLSEAGTNNLAIRLAGCRKEPKECVEAAEAEDNKLGRLLGLALYFARRASSTSSVEDAARASELADEAMAEMKRLVSVREQKAAQLKNEAALVTKARSDCKASSVSCRQGCDNNEYPMCVALAIQLAQARKFSEARTALQKACDGQFATACASMADLAQAEASVTERTESTWSSVVSAADDIAQRRHMASFARQNAPTAQNLAAAQRVDAHVAMLIRDSYCPAVKDFLERSTRADFQARAKEHCDKEPPTGSSLGGEDVVLTAQCRQVFATACP